MARKAAKKRAEGSTAANQGAEVESSVIALAEQLGTFLGQVTAKGEGWLDNDALREQATMIRDGASEVLKRVNSAGAAAKQSVTTAKQSVTKAVKSRIAKPAKEEDEESNARPSRGAVDAPGKKHRKPPPQQKVMRGTTVPMGKRQGLKTYKVGSGRRG
jgi:hypothetical protein